VIDVPHQRDHRRRRIKSASLLLDHPTVFLRLLTFFPGPHSELTETVPIVENKGPGDRGDDALEDST